VDLRPTAQPTPRPTRDPSAPAPTSIPTTATRTHVTYEVDHTLLGIDVAAFGCPTCSEALAAAVKAAAPLAKIRAASYSLVYSKDSTPVRRRSLTVRAVDLRYRGSFVAEDTGISGVSAAFAAVKRTFEETVASGNFTKILHAESRTHGAVTFNQVTSSTAVMKLVSDGSVGGGGGNGGSEAQNLGFFEGLPAYGRWFFSLGMCALGLGVSWAYYHKVHKRKVKEDKFKGIDAVEEESGVVEWGSSHHGEGVVVETPVVAAGERNGDDAEDVKVKHTRHTPLSARTASVGREHRFIAPMVSPLPATSTPNSPAKLNIVDVTSAHHLDIAVESDDDDLFFGY